MRPQKTLSRSAYDLLDKGNAPTVLLLTHVDGDDYPEGMGQRYAGRIVAAYALTEAPSGGHTCYATVGFWDGPLAAVVPNTSTGKAGGGGYCKTSAAIVDAITRGWLPASDAGRPTMANAGQNCTYADASKLHGTGVPSVVRWLESLGYGVLVAIGG